MRGHWHKRHKGMPKVLSREHCNRTIVEGVPNAELPEWATNRALKFEVKDDALLFVFEIESEGQKDRTFVPVSVRIPLGQRTQLETQAGHIG